MYSFSRIINSEILAHECIGEAGVILIVETGRWVKFNRSLEGKERKIPDIQIPNISRADVHTLIGNP